MGRVEHQQRQGGRGRGGEVEERMQGWCHGGNRMKHKKQKEKCVVVRMKPTHWLQIWTGSEVKWSCLSDVTLHHSSQEKGSVLSLFLYLNLSPVLLLTVRLFSNCCSLTMCVRHLSLIGACDDVAMCQLPSALVLLYSGKTLNAYTVYMPIYCIYTACKCNW